MAESVFDDFENESDDGFVPEVVRHAVFVFYYSLLKSHLLTYVLHGSTVLISPSHRSLRLKLPPRRLPPRNQLRSLKLHPRRRFRQHLRVARLPLRSALSLIATMMMTMFRAFPTRLPMLRNRRRPPRLKSPVAHLWARSRMIV